MPGKSTRKTFNSDSNYLEQMLLLLNSNELQKNLEKSRTVLRDFYSNEIGNILREQVSSLKSEIQDEFSSSSSGSSGSSYNPGLSNSADNELYNMGAQAAESFSKGMDEGAGKSSGGGTSGGGWKSLGNKIGGQLATSLIDSLNKMMNTWSSNTFGSLNLSGSFGSGNALYAQIRESLGNLTFADDKSLKGFSNTITDSFKQLQQDGVLVSPTTIYGMYTRLGDIVSISGTQNSRLTSLLNVVTEMNRAGGSQLDTTGYAMQLLTANYSEDVAKAIQANMNIAATGGGRWDQTQLTEDVGNLILNSKTMETIVADAMQNNISSAELIRRTEDLSQTFAYIAGEGRLTSTAIEDLVSMMDRASTASTEKLTGLFGTGDKGIAALLAGSGLDTNTMMTREGFAAHADELLISIIQQLGTGSLSYDDSTTKKILLEGFGVDLNNTNTITELQSLARKFNEGDISLEGLRQFVGTSYSDTQRDDYYKAISSTNALTDALNFQAEAAGLGASAVSGEDPVVGWLAVIGTTLINFLGENGIGSGIVSSLFQGTATGIVSGIMSGTGAAAGGISGAGSGLISLLGAAGPWALAVAGVAGLVALGVHQENETRKAVNSSFSEMNPSIVTTADGIETIKLSTGVIKDKLTEGDSSEDTTPSSPWKETPKSANTDVQDYLGSNANTGDFYAGTGQGTTTGVQIWDPKTRSYKTVPTNSINNKQFTGEELQNSINTSLYGNYSDPDSGVLNAFTNAQYTSEVQNNPANTQISDAIKAGLTDESVASTYTYNSNNVNQVNYDPFLSGSGIDPSKLQIPSGKSAIILQKDPTKINSNLQKGKDYIDLGNGYYAVFTDPQGNDLKSNSTVFSSGWIGKNSNVISNLAGLDTSLGVNPLTNANYIENGISAALGDPVFKDLYKAYSELGILPYDNDTSGPNIYKFYKEYPLSNPGANVMKAFNNNRGVALFGKNLGDILGGLATTTNYGLNLGFLASKGFDITRFMTDAENNDYIKQDPELYNKISKAYNTISGITNEDAASSNNYVEFLHTIFQKQYADDLYRLYGALGNKPLTPDNISSIPRGTFLNSKFVDVIERYGYATGLDNIPYDGFPAILHEGEMVIPARRANWLRVMMGQKPVNYSNVPANKNTGNNSFVQSLPEYASGIDAVNWAKARSTWTYDRAKRNQDGFFDCSSLVTRAWRGVDPSSIGAVYNTAGIYNALPREGWTVLFDAAKAGDYGHMPTVISAVGAQAGDIALTYNHSGSGHSLGNGFRTNHAVFIESGNSMYHIFAQGKPAASQPFYSKGNRLVALFRYGGASETVGTDSMPQTNNTGETKPTGPIPKSIQYLMGLNSTYAKNLLKSLGYIGGDTVSDGANTTTDTITGGALTNLAQQRAKFNQELQNTAVLYKTLNRAASEYNYGYKESGAEVGVGYKMWLESAINRAYARGISLLTAVDGNYFGGGRGKASSSKPDRYDVLKAALDEVLAGSNYSNYATGNGTSNKNVYVRAMHHGEPFVLEKQTADMAWAKNMGVPEPWGLYDSNNGYVKLAEGGIVRATPGGIPTIIGEGKSDEAVIPLKENVDYLGIEELSINIIDALDIFCDRVCQRLDAIIKNQQSNSNSEDSTIRLRTAQRTERLMALKNLQTTY